MTDAKPYRHRFPMIIIQHAVWLYHRFPLSYRDVQELLHQRVKLQGFHGVSVQSVPVVFKLSG